MTANAAACPQAAAYFYKLVCRLGLELLLQGPVEHVFCRGGGTHERGGESFAASKLLSPDREQLQATPRIPLLPTFFCPLRTCAKELSVLVLVALHAAELPLELRCRVDGGVGHLLLVHLKRGKDGRGRCDGHLQV